MPTRRTVPLALTAAVLAVSCVVGGVAVADGGTAEPITEPAPITLPEPAQASLVPDKSAAFNAGVRAGLDYWLGRDGFTPPVVIMRDKTNLCGKGAMGCAAGYSDGSCRIWVKKSILKDRWATTAVLLHEVGHCMGHGHDDADLIMHG